MSWNKDEIATSFDKIAKRASTDAMFRDLCLKDAGAAVKQETGKELPSGYKLRFVDKAGADMTLILPDMVSAQGELSDRDLESVAGGKCDRTCCSSAGPAHTPGDRGTVSGGLFG